ncbi:alpha/beta hydrolase [Natrialba sp. PRR66]|uniref:alpha/beta fold hydrolase n=1 Tax=Natrialba sp. PRR66 TaxID=3098146 RepID=UPI002B1E732C|nr:alpha/beta hydrolase [Natrialba sp. PRR66]
MTELAGRYADVDGTRIYYEAVGDSNDQSVVLVHTAGADGRQWRYVAPALADRGYHVVVPDLPGHGKSYPTEWEPHVRIGQHADAVWALGEHLNLDQPAIGGCSIGGDVTLDIAVNHATDLTAAVAMEGAGKTRGAQLGRLSHSHAIPGWQDVLDYSVIDSTGPDCPAEYRTELAWQHRSAQEVATNDLQAWADFDILEDLHRAECPVMLVRGDADYFIQDDVFAETVERLPDCEPIVLNGVGHYPMMERPDEVTELLDEFIERQ